MQVILLIHIKPFSGNLGSKFDLLANFLTDLNVQKIYDVISHFKILVKRNQKQLFHVNIFTIMKFMGIWIFQKHDFLEKDFYIHNVYTDNSYINKLQFF